MEGLLTDYNDIAWSDKKNYAESTRKHQTYFDVRDKPSTIISQTLAKHVVQQYLSPGDSIILDSGATCAFVADEIAVQALSNPGLFYSIMTHNYAAFQTLVKRVPRERLNVFFAGGRYEENLNAVLGWPTLKAYEEFTASVTILSASGIVASEGVFTHGNTEESEVKRLLFRKPTTRRILIVGNNKIGKRDSLLIDNTETLGNDAEQCVLVTDRTPPELSRARKERLNMELEQLESTDAVAVAVVDAE